VKKTILVLTYGDTYDLKKVMPENSTSSHIFKVIDLSSEKIGFWTWLGIASRYYFACIVLVLNVQFFEDMNCLKLAKLVLKSYRPLFVNIDPVDNYPHWFPKESVNRLELPTSADDVRAGFQTLNSLPARSHSARSFFQNDD
jgi:hypothetical protein